MSMSVKLRSGSATVMSSQKTKNNIQVNGDSIENVNSHFFMLLLISSFLFFFTAKSLCRFVKSTNCHHNGNIMSASNHGIQNHSKL